MHETTTLEGAKAPTRSHAAIGRAVDWLSAGSVPIAGVATCLVLLVVSSGCTYSPEPGASGFGSEVTFTRPPGGPIVGDIDAGIVRQIESIYDENFGAGANLTIAKIVRQKPSVYSVIYEQVLKNDTYRTLGPAGHHVNIKARTAIAWGLD